MAVVHKILALTNFINETQIGRHWATWWMNLHAMHWLVLIKEILAVILVPYCVTWAFIFEDTYNKTFEGENFHGSSILCREHFHCLPMITYFSILSKMFSGKTFAVSKNPQKLPKFSPQTFYHIRYIPACSSLLYIDIA